MIQKLSKIDLRERYKKLSPELQEALFSEMTADKVFDIGKQHSLTINNTGEMASEIGNLMLGVTHPDEFVGNLASRLQIDKPKAKEIADDINRDIFAPVREHLRTMFGGAGGEEKPVISVTPSPVAAKPLEKQQVVDGKYQGKEEQKSESQDTRYKIQDTKPQAIPQQKQKTVTQPSHVLPPKTSFEDLEAELKKTIEEEHSEEPLNILKPAPPKSPAEQKIDVPRYTGNDPYREQVEDNMPNVKGAPFVMEQGAHTMEQKKKEEKSAQPPPFSPIPPKPQSTKELQANSDSYREKITPEAASGTKPDGTLKQFRGFNMATTPQLPEREANTQKTVPYKEPLQ